jgi:hypothetical protein
MWSIWSLLVVRVAAETLVLVVAQVDCLRVFLV